MKVGHSYLRRQLLSRGVVNAGTIMTVDVDPSAAFDSLSLSAGRKPLDPAHVRSPFIFFSLDELYLDHVRPE